MHVFIQIYTHCKMVTLLLSSTVGCSSTGRWWVGRLQRPLSVSTHCTHVPKPSHFVFKCNKEDYLSQAPAHSNIWCAQVTHMSKQISQGLQFQQQKILLHSNNSATLRHVPRDQCSYRAIWVFPSTCNGCTQGMCTYMQQPVFAATSGASHQIF